MPRIDVLTLCPRCACQALQAATNYGAGIRIGIVDSGLDTEHPLLAAVVSNPSKQTHNFTGQGDGKLDVKDYLGHVTNIAGIIAGQPTDAIAGGIARNARVYVAKVTTTDKCVFGCLCVCVCV